MLKTPYQRLESVFNADRVIYWSNLIRLNNLMVIMNISIFFLTGLVAKGYFFTFYSLICLGGVGIAALVPTALTRRLWYYWIFLVTELIGLYFLVASIVYWVQNGPG